MSVFFFCAIVLLLIVKAVVSVLFSTIFHCFTVSFMCAVCTLSFIVLNFQNDNDSEIDNRKGINEMKALE